MKGKFLLTALIIVLAVGTGHAQTLNIATYNLRYENKADSVSGNGWGQRYPVISKLIRFHDFDIFGTQEGMYHQLQNLSDSLPGYKYIGVGREDGIRKSEFSAIFYKTDKFKLLNSGNFWLAPVTDKPTIGWDAALKRVCTWGEFQEKKTGFKFYLFNVHMDHVGVIARKESCKLILQKIKELKSTIPVILTGDFNVDQFNESYTLLNTSDVLKDAYVLSPLKYAEATTFNGFDITASGNRRIDHIFLTKHFKVDRYGILTDSYNRGHLPSDHLPVMIQVSYK
jgi:endonuclease/exonuclease/phosphatase family metal-dependent hydrolase